MERLRIPLRVVYYRDEENDWIAHCLEFDLCGHGSDRKLALDMLTEAIAIQVDESIKANNPTNLFSPAPGTYFRMFAAGTDCTVGQIEISQKSIHVGETTAREFSGDYNLLEFA